MPTPSPTSDPPVDPRVDPAVMEFSRIYARLPEVVQDRVISTEVYHVNTFVFIRVHTGYRRYSTYVCISDDGFRTMKTTTINAIMAQQRHELVVAMLNELGWSMEKVCDVTSFTERQVHAAFNNEQPASVTLRQHHH